MEIHRNVARLLNSFAAGIVVNAITAVALAPAEATSTTEGVSRASDGAQGNCSSMAPSISATAQFIAFQSCASNLVIRVSATSSSTIGTPEQP